jgi:hypothetical protein
MVRLLAVLLVGACLAGSARASFSPRDSLRGLEERGRLAVLRKLAPFPPQSLVTANRPEQFLVTEDTQVQVDGKPCRYQDVPEGAAIVRLALAADGRTVLRIEFRTQP